MLLNNSVIIDYGLLCYLLRMMFFLDLSVFIGMFYFCVLDRDLSTKFHSFMYPVYGMTIKNP